MLTILHTESSLGWGGQENRTLHECAGLVRLGAQAVILCKPGSKLKERAERVNIKVFTHPMRSNRDISAVRYAMRLVRDESIDVICTHSGDDSFLFALAGRLSRRKPAIVRTRHLALPITSKLTYSLFPHRVVTVSEFVRRYLVEEKGLDAGRVAAIATGIDLSVYDPDKAVSGLRAELGLADDALIVGVVAILRRKKGHHILLEAIPRILSEVPKAVFVFAGNGAQRENIEAQIAKLGIGSSVKLLGLRTDVPAILAGLDLFVLPTLEEALGTSVLEAAAMKKAVVATRVGGVPEVVRHGVTGLLVAPDDAPSLAGAIAALLKNAELRSSMGAAGRSMVESEYSVEVMAARLFKFYEELAGRKNKGYGV